MDATSYDPALEKHPSEYAGDTRPFASSLLRSSPSQGGSFFSRHKRAILTGSILLTLCAAATLAGLLVTKPWNKSVRATQDSSNSEAAVPTSNDTTNVHHDEVLPKFSKDPAHPTTLEFDGTVRCNAYTPPLAEPFLYGKQPIRGVNLGGWLVLEPFITPSLFEPYVSQGVTDEFTLTKLLGQDKARELLRRHYSTWVTEDTFKRIRDLGLNHVRIPIGFWALGNLAPDEPYVPDLALDYLLQGLKWAAKYGLRVMVEIHGAPGSQNGWNHSGHAGKIHWVDGTPLGTKNGQRTIEYVRQLARMLNEPGFDHVAPIFGILNEPAIFMLERKNTDRWYKDAFATLRNATGGVGRGPWAVIHDGFLGLSEWEGFMPHSDRLVLDVHQYLIFDHYLIRLPRNKQATFPCEAWAKHMARSNEAFGPTLVGEFSSATNDCAKWLNGIGFGTRWEGTYANEEESGAFDDEAAATGDAVTAKNGEHVVLQQDQQQQRPPPASALAPQSKVPNADEDEKARMISINKEKRQVPAVAKNAACQPTKNGGLQSDYCSCAKQNDVNTFSPEYRQFLSDFTQAQMDAFEKGIGWFYWNFKTETNTLWSYFDGVDQGWIPRDINNRPGGCKALGRHIG
ncbi:hypothetical protein BGZ73_007373 [Actinomortierella ambigua]|nr:hypothetical protein BGZ73_007373 [Actinomortierella ambigua]